MRFPPKAKRGAKEKKMERRLFCRPCHRLNLSLLLMAPQLFCSRSTLFSGPLMSIDSLLGSFCQEVVIRERVTEHVPSLADYSNRLASSRRLHRPSTSYRRQVERKLCLSAGCALSTISISVVIRCSSIFIRTGSRMIRK